MLQTRAWARDWCCCDTAVGTAAAMGECCCCCVYAASPGDCEHQGVMLWLLFRGSLLTLSKQLGLGWKPTRQRPSSSSLLLLLCSRD